MCPGDILGRSAEGQRSSDRDLFARAGDAPALRRFVHLYAYEARDPRLLHGHAIEHVDRLHRALDVRDEDELRASGHLADELVVAGYVGFIERRVDLVEYAEG